MLPEAAKPQVGNCTVATETPGADLNDGAASEHATILAIKYIMEHTKAFGTITAYVIVCVRAYVRTCVRAYVRCLCAY